MNIISVTDGDSYQVETDEGAYSVPKDEGNRHYGLVQEWLAIPGNDLLPEPPEPDPPTIDEVYDQTIQNQKVLKALALCLNDGSFVPGSNHTGAQLKAIVKAKM